MIFLFLFKFNNIAYNVFIGVFTIEQHHMFGGVLIFEQHRHV